MAKNLTELWQVCHVNKNHAGILYLYITESGRKIVSCLGKWLQARKEAYRCFSVKHEAWAECGLIYFSRVDLLILGFEFVSIAADARKSLGAAVSQLPLRLVYNYWRQLKDMVNYYVMLFEQVKTH